MPTHRAMPMRDIMLNVKPAMYMAKKVEIKDVGMAIMTASVDRQPRRKKNKTSPVVHRPSMRVCQVLCKEFRIYEADSLVTVNV